MAFHQSLDVLLPYALAAGLGGLIGLERERHRHEKNVLAGVRTYPMVALTGLLATALGDELGSAILVSVAALVVGAFALQMYWVRQAHGTLGLTSPVALFATYFVGVLVGVGREFEAIVFGLALALLLFTRDRLHRLAEVMTPQEMEGALYFLILAFVLYPILDPEPVLNALRLRQILLVVLLVSLISFVSFLALRRYGSQYGLAFSGFLGGLVNSEATTASLAQIHRLRKGLRTPALAGILLASGTMFLRNLAIAAIADHTLRLAQALVLPLLVPSLVYLMWALVVSRKPAEETSEPLVIQSPFAFRPAFKFAFWFAAVSLATYYLINSQLTWGIYAAALGGLVSAAAVVASMGALVNTGAAPLDAAATTAALACLVSASNKPFIARLGSWELSRRILPATTVAIVVGGVLLATI